MQRTLKTGKERCENASKSFPVFWFCGVENVVFFVLFHKNQNVLLEERTNVLVILLTFSLKCRAKCRIKLGERDKKMKKAEKMKKSA